MNSFQYKEKTKSSYCSTLFSKRKTKVSDNKLEKQRSNITVIIYRKLIMVVEVNLML